MTLGRYRDPARPARPVVHIAGAIGSRSEVRRIFRRAGWAVRFAPAIPEPLDVEVHLVESKLPTMDDEPRWPLPITLPICKRMPAFGSDCGGGRRFCPGGG